MKESQAFSALRGLIQKDPGGRGLDRPGASLFARCARDLQGAVESLILHPAPVVGVVTGFWIPSWGRYETDGPPGAVFLAQVLPRLGIGVRLFTDPGCLDILKAGLAAAGCSVDLAEAISPRVPEGVNVILAVERVGPGHTVDSLRGQADTTQEDVARFVGEIPEAEQGRCRTMRGLDVTEQHSSIEGWLTTERGLLTIGVGDGGNEVGMGKIPWSLIREAVPGGGRIACRIPTRHLIVAGVSNWGAYALAAGVALERSGVDAAEFDPDREKAILAAMVEAGLVDGVTGRQATTVDGLEWEVHAEVLRGLGAVVGRGA